jgi:serine/threonine-protein kinase
MSMTEGRIPSTIAPGADIAPELDAVCTRCCAPNPQDRFPSTGAVAEAVDRFLDGDRDLATRRTLAQAQVDAAEEAMRASPSGDGDAKATAVRALTRALALDPHHQMASERLGTLLMDVSGDLPHEAALELRSLQARTSRTATQVSLGRIMAIVALTILGLILGVRDTQLAAMVCGGIAISVLFSFLWLKAKTDRIRSLHLILSALSVIIAMIALNNGFGPAILVPTVGLANGLLILAQTDFRRLDLALGICAIPAVWPFVVAVAGHGPWPFEITPDAIVIPSRLVFFPPAFTMFTLAAFALGSTTAPLIVTAKLRNRLRSVEERLFLHSWHLRQLTTHAPSIPTDSKST